jgi:integrase
VPSVERYQAGTRSDGRPVYKWRGRYRDAAKKMRSKTFPLKSQALRWAGEQEAKVYRGERSDVVSARMRWGQWADMWWHARTVEPGTKRRDESRMKVHVRPRWDDVPLIAITKRDVQAWVNTISAKRSPSTTRNAFHLLSNSLKEAVEEGILVANPCSHVTLPTQPHGQERFLTDAEVDRILFHLDGRYRLFAELLVGTGLRLGEACGLHAARVDLGAQRLQVIETWDPADGAIKAYPKSKRRRVVPLSDELAERLQRWLDQNPPAKTCGKPHRAGRCPGGMLIPGPQGAPMHGPNFERRHWNTAIRHAGIGDARVHDLRHSYASHLLQQGIPLERVQMLLGHADIATTQRYAHLVQDDWDAVRTALSSSVTAARAEESGGPNLRAL